MDPEPAGVTDAGPRPAAARGLRRRRAAVLAVIAVLSVLAVVLAVLVTRVGAPDSARPAAAPRPTATASPSVPVIYQRVRPSVVLVRTSHDLGTGVVVADDGTILTANHVVAGKTARITVTFYDGTTARAAVVSANPKLDVAVLRPASLPAVVVPAALGGNAGVGAQVVAIGNPLGLTDSVSTGVVSGLNRTARTAAGSFSGLIQFDASVNPGSSGGPLLDAGGRVVGIVVSIANPANQDAFAGIGFAVPIGSALGGKGGAGSGDGPQI